MRPSGSVNPFRTRDDKIRVRRQRIARHEFARARRPDGAEPQPCPPHRRGGDSERAGFCRAVDHGVQHGHVAADRRRLLRRDRCSKLGVGASSKCCSTRCPPSSSASLALTAAIFARDFQRVRILDPPFPRARVIIGHPSFNCQTARGYASAFSRLKCARALCRFRPPRNLRAQGKPGARCTRDLACDLRKQNCTRAYRAAEASRLSLRDGLRLTSCSPRRTALLPPSPQRSFASLGLSASTAAPEPHDFAVR